MSAIVIVTGGAQGIGRAIAKRLAASGTRVAVWDTIEGSGEETAQMCRASGGDGAFWRVDVGVPSDVLDAAEAVERRWGIPDALVNNAAIFPRSDPLEMDLAEWNRVLQVNLTGTFVCARVVAKSRSRKLGIMSKGLAWSSA